MAVSFKGVVNSECAALATKMTSKGVRDAQDTFLQESGTASGGSIIPCEGVMAFFYEDGSVGSNLNKGRVMSLFGPQCKFDGDHGALSAKINVSVRGRAYVYNNSNVSIKRGQTVGYSLYAPSSMYLKTCAPTTNAKAALILPVGASQIEDLMESMYTQTSYQTNVAIVAAADAAAAGGAGAGIALYDARANTAYTNGLATAADVTASPQNRVFSALAAYRFSTTQNQEVSAARAAIKMLSQFRKELFVEFGVARRDIPPGSGANIELFRH